MDWSSWVTAVASVVSAAMALAMWLVSRATLKLQSSIEAAKSPQVHVWYNGPGSLTPKVVSSVSVVNIGQTTLPIRAFRIIGQDGQAVKFLFSDESHGSNPKKIDREMAVARLSVLPKVKTDLILLPNRIYKAFFETQSGQFKIEAMYYDNSFEFLEIDTSILGGKYVLTGKAENKFPSGGNDIR